MVRCGSDAGLRYLSIVCYHQLHFYSRCLVCHSCRHAAQVFDTISFLHRKGRGGGWKPGLLAHLLKARKL